MSDFKTYRWYRFWLKSDKGLSTHVHKFLPENTNIVAELAKWCSQYGTHFRDHCTWGHEEIDSPPRDVLIQKISALEQRMEEDQALVAEYVNQTTVQDY